MAKEKAWDTTAKNTAKKTIDEKIAGFERDLNHFDRAMDAQKDKIKSDVEDLEHSFDDFITNSMDDLMECCGLDMDKMKAQFEAEMASLKKELEFSTKAVKKSFDHLMGQFKDREKT